MQLDWAREELLISTDKTSLQSHGWFYCYKKGQKTLPKTAYEGSGTWEGISSTYTDATTTPITVDAMAESSGKQSYTDLQNAGGCSGLEMAPSWYCTYTYV